MTKYVVCLSTAASRRDGEKVARHLVEIKKVACVNVVANVTSFYRWKKKLCRDAEVLLVMKTTNAKVPSLKKELLKIHPYDVPEFIVLPILKGSPDYLNWIQRSVTK